jgi:hypothetical protein
LTSRNLRGRKKERRLNPLEDKNKTPEELRRYFAASAGFWMEAVLLQEKRCESRHGEEEPRGYAIDLSFYIVALCTLCEIAGHASGRPLNLESIVPPLKSLYRRWPNLRDVRHVLVHALPVMSDATSGHYGPSFAPGQMLNLLPGGRVSYLIDVREAKPMVRELYNALTQALE